MLSNNGEENKGQGDEMVVPLSSALHGKSRDDRPNENDKQRWPCQESGIDGNG